MSNKELIKAGHGLAKTLNSDTPLLDIAKQLSELASALDVQTARANALAAENWNMSDVLRQLIAKRPGGVYFIKWEPLVFKALNETPATDAFLAELRNEARAEGVGMFVSNIASGLRTGGGAWGVFQEPYHEFADYLEDRGERFSRQLLEGKDMPGARENIEYPIEYQKNTSPSNGWTICPEFLSRVSERAAEFYGYQPGLEETEAALLAGLDLLREGKAGEVQS